MSIFILVNNGYTVVWLEIEWYDREDYLKSNDRNASDILYGYCENGKSLQT